MRAFIICLNMLLLFSCSEGRKQPDKDVEIIPVATEQVTRDASCFIEKIEAVPLYTDTLSLLKGYRKLIYDRNSDLYAILDNRFIVLLFSGDGHFVSSSEAKQGEGPDQYQMIVDIKFNPFEKGIDLLNPYGKIYTYDYGFNLISQKDLGQTGCSFSHFMAYDKGKYVLTPSLLMDDQSVYWLDYALKEKRKANYEGTLSSINMDRESFYRQDSACYFIPTGINYYFYRMDMDTHRLLPYMKLDFGQEEITEDGLPGKATADVADVSSQQHQAKFIRQLRERNAYLEKSSHILPLIKFFNDEYVYVHYIKNRQPSNYIYNRRTRTGFLQHGEEPLKMPFCFAMDGAVLYAVADAFEVEEYMDRKWMSEETVEKLEKVKEDDNPVILKYYLK